MIDITDLCFVILCVLGSILLIVLIILGIKMIKTVNKVNNVVTDIDTKQKKLDGVFDIIDTATDTLSIVSDKVVGTVASTLTALFTKRKKKEDEDNEEE
ncbi:MAG: hypothetical protein J6G98_02135 [Bacilli bacterium]|nr:hypothetical protein [Bacilli bacterium]